MSISQLVLVTKNSYSAHNKFSENTQVVDRTGKPVGENSSNAQIRRPYLMNRDR